MHEMTLIMAFLGAAETSQLNLEHSIFFRALTAFHTPHITHPFC